MTKLYGLLMMVLAVLFAAGCGDDEESNEPNDTEDNTDTESETAVDAGDNSNEVEALAACTDFLTTSWDRIRDCGSEIADVLPANTLAAGICSGFCETEDAVISRTDFDACLAKAEGIECDAIPSDVNEVLSQLPEECAFLSDSLNCQFPEV